MKNAISKLLTNEFTIDEWHSWVIGWAEIICSWKPRIDPTQLQYLQSEYHYYVFGRACGFVCLLAMLCGFVKIML